MTSRRVRWPLEALELLRTREEEAASAAAARAADVERDVRAQRDAARAALAAYLGRRRPAIAPLPSAGELARGARFGARLRSEEARLRAGVAAAEARLAAAAAGAAAAREAFAAVRAGRRALKRHRERWDEARRRARERAEDAAIEDAVLGRAR